MPQADQQSEGKASSYGVADNYEDEDFDDIEEDLPVDDVQLHDEGMMGVSGQGITVS